MIVQTNIGLENHKIGSTIVNQLCKEAFGKDNVILDYVCKFSEGGDWDPELILIQRIDVTDLKTFFRGVESIARVLGEEAIACHRECDWHKSGVIIFNPIKECERYVYDHRYFVEL